MTNYKLFDLKCNGLKSPKRPFLMFSRSFIQNPRGEMYAVELSRDFGNLQVPMVCMDHKAIYEGRDIYS